MDTICRRYNIRLVAAALQFSVRDQRIHSTVMGMTRQERVTQTMDLALHPIPDELWQQLDAVRLALGDV